MRQSGFAGYRGLNTQLNTLQLNMVSFRSGRSQKDDRISRGRKKGSEMAKKKIEDLIRDMLQEFFDANGYELFRTEFVKEGKDWFLRVYIDKMVDGEYVNVGVEDCEAVSRYLSDKLDEEDPIEQNYYLEVSSPGMDRPLLRDKDFVRFAGEVVEIKLYKGFEGKKFYEGVLVERNEEFLVIRDEKDQELQIPRDMISKVNLAVIF